MGFFKVQIAAVNGATADHAFHALVFHGAQLFDVGHVGQTARGDDWDRHGLCQFDGGVDVDAGQHAIAADVGVDDGLDAVVFKLLAKVSHVVACELAPTVGSHFAVFGIEADDDVAAKGAARIAQEAGVLHGGCADDDVAQASVDVFFNRVEVANAATQLHGDVVAHGFQNGFDGRFVLGCAGESAVQVHQVQATCAFGHPVERHLRWVFTEGGGLLHVTLFEAHAMSVFEIDGGN